MKLLQLGISDNEVIDNLRGVGVNSETARSMLEETRAEMASSPQAQQAAARHGRQDEKETRLPEPDEGGDVEIPDDIYSRIGDEEGAGRARRDVPVSGSAAGQDYGHASHSDEHVEALWQKGVLSTVDAKLNEMKKIKADLDAEIDARVDARMKLETKKIETVLESQRSMSFSKIDAHLESRAKELRDVLESRARQSVDLNEKVQSSLAKTQGENKFNAELLNTLNDRLSGLDTVKSQMISETNKSLIGTESKFKDFMDDAERRRDEYEIKLNSALELQSKIAEGLTEELRQKIDSLKFEKEEEITGRIRGKVEELDRLIEQADPKGVAEMARNMQEIERELVQKQKELDLQFARSNDGLKKYVDSYMADVRKDFGVLKKEVAKVQAERLEGLQKEYAENVDELFSQNLVEWDKKLKEKRKEIDELKARIDIGKLDAAMESLDLFKEQFLNTVKKSLGEFARLKKDIAENMASRDKTVTEHLRRVDEKMKELSEFEKKFSTDVSGLLGEMQSGKRAKREPERARKPRPGS